MRSRFALHAVTIGLAVTLAAPGAGAADRATSSRSEPAAAAVRTPLVVIVNRSNPILELERRELRALFLGERTTWPNGRRVTLVLREPGQPERTAAVRLIAGMSEDDLTRHFIHQTFNGNGTSGPRALATAEGVKRFVFNVPGAIGVIRQADLDDTVKAIRILGTGPADASYSLVMGES